MSALKLVVWAPQESCWWGRSGGDCVLDLVDEQAVANRSTRCGLLGLLVLAEELSVEGACLAVWLEAELLIE